MMSKTSCRIMSKTSCWMMSKVSCRSISYIRHDVQTSSWMMFVHHSSWCIDIMLDDVQTSNFTYPTWCIDIMKNDVQTSSNLMSVHHPTWCWYINLLSATPIKINKCRILNRQTFGLFFFWRTDYFFYSHLFNLSWFIIDFNLFYCNLILLFKCTNNINNTKFLNKNIK